MHDRSNNYGGILPMIKIIHFANVRFDASLGLSNASKAGIRREEMKNTFTELMTFIRENSVQLALVSGNLFDQKNIGRPTLKYIMDSFDSCPDCKFVIAPGELDFFSNKSVYATTAFPNNVSIFKSEELSCFEFDFNGEAVRVYGHACLEPDSLSFPCEIQNIEGKDESVNILISPTDIEGISDRVNLPANIGADYVALKGEGGKAEIFDEGDMWYAYPGTLEPLSFDDAGEGGFVLIEAQKQNGEFICRPKLVSLMKKRYVTKIINASGASKESDFTDAAKAFFESDLSINENTLLRLIYIGDVFPALQFPSEKITEIANERKLFYFELADETVPLYNHEFLSEDPTIKGALFNALRSEMCSDDPNVRECATGAFRTGMNALKGNRKKESSYDADI